MRKTLIVLFLLIELYSSASDKVKIHIHVKNGIGKEITFNVFDNYITRDTWDYTCMIDSAGCGIVSFKLDRPREAFFQAKGNYFLFLTPGDKLEIYFDYNNPIETITYKGTGAVHCNFIIENRRNFQDPYLGGNLIKQGLSNEEYKQEINKRWQNRQAFYSKYSKENELSRQFKYYAQGLVDYSSILEHLFLQARLKKLNKSIENVSEFYSFLNADYFRNDSLLDYSQQYLSTVSFYRSICENTQKYDTIHSKIYQDFRSFYSNRTRDYLIAMYLIHAYGSDENFVNDYHDFKNICEDNEILNILDEAFAKYNQSEIPKQVLNSVIVSYEGKKLTLKKLLSRYKGKVVYIDFWSSFCAPCLKEIPYLERLRSNVKELPIEIISFSVDNNSLEWKKTIDKMGMSTDNQYLLSKSLQSDICSYYSIKGIPRFFIIDKNSRLVNASAPRASDSAIKEKLISLIN